MKKYKSTLCFALILSFALVSFGCSAEKENETHKASTNDEPQNTEKQTERNYNIPISTGYSVEVKEDGYHYITFEDFDYYWYRLRDMGWIPSIETNSIKQFQTELENGLLSEGNKTALMNFYRANDEKNKEIKVCNFNDFYIPTLPSNLYIYNEGFRFSSWNNSYYSYFLCWGDIKVADDGSVSFEPGGYSATGSLYFNLDDEYNNSYATCEARGYKYHKVQEGNKTVEAFYNDLHLYLYITQDNQRCYIEMGYYIDYNGGLPSDEWLLSFGMEKYVEEPAQ